MKIVRALLGTLLWFTLTGCQTVDTDLDRPARIVNADADSRAALQAAVNEALGNDVLLAEDALTDSSLLTIERWPAGTMENPVPQGRILEKPIQFRLVINDSDCILIDQRNASRHVLQDTECAAE
jgi:hypothetical protein